MSSLIKSLKLKALLAVICLAAMSGAYAQQGTYNWSSARHLYPGIKHARIVVNSPRLMNINCMRIDVNTNGLKFYETPRYKSWTQDVSETKRQRTRDFIRESQTTDKKLVAAINANFFSPWPVPWNEESLGNVIGLAVSDGTLVSPGTETPAFIVYKDGSPRIEAFKDGDVSGIQAAVCGSGVILSEGNAVSSDDDLEPRTAVGISKDHKYVVFLTIDGRQNASKGATLQEVGSWLKYFGSYTGINLDGGGSTTMAWWNPKNCASDKAELLNLPVGSGTVYDVSKSEERCVGNSIGVYFADNNKK